MKNKPYVYKDTIWSKVGGGFSNPGESKIVNIGKHKVLVSRADRLDRYGNPVHSATYVNKDGSLGKSARSNGNATLVVSDCLKKNGINVKYNNLQSKIRNSK